MTSNKDILLLAKSQGGRISASEYRTLINKQSTNKNSSTEYNFQFKLELEQISSTEYKFVLFGRHYSTNEVNSWLSFGKRNSYKNAIKDAFSNYFLINKNKKIKIPFEKSIMYSIAYNTRSRDDDGNRITLKPFRDMLTDTGFIKDDSRKHFFELPNYEILSKEYKIEIYLKQVEQLPTLNDLLRTDKLFY